MSAFSREWSAQTTASVMVVRIVEESTRMSRVMEVLRETKLTTH